MSKAHTMAHPRRFLPSISLLAAFDAVMRTGSTLAAAHDLDLTQGAVSRLIRALEDQLGRQLFLREGRRLKPTDHARAYARDVARVLDLLGQASQRVQADTGAGTLALAILPSFGSHWLMPRLPRFLSAHPGLRLSLGTRLRPFDFDSEGFDAAIHFGTPDWPGVASAELFGESLVPVCAPGLAPEPADMAALLALPLLGLDTRPRAWAEWCAAQGLDAAPAMTLQCDQFAPLTEAAIHGLGVALLPDFLARPALAAGHLVAPWGGATPASGAYYLVWPEVGAWYPPLRAFRDWLRAEAAPPQATRA
ncbi:LysR family transcriptional regulator [Rhodobacteraceae bacterium 2376]|uniref:LysR family transcriptional regulator n=1 Tax=Rhabdonatronobacter sediminivivens TaxID=2743469 RepID=A0A7Z0I297_9RHOB|nr:LysR family transcriptional regulator [Rhabdonatronobacter sediminivivens]NYS26252.1 LysR family transcriptional regulator [Rhabdonatronobacter sediminivivens]